MIIKKVQQTLKLRIYPTKSQIQQFEKTVGCCRKVYNFFLNERNEFYENIIKVEEDKKKQKALWKTFKLTTEKDLKNQFSYLNEVSSQALQQSRIDCETAFKNFFKSKNGFPKFKSKKQSKQSFRECMISKNPLNLDKNIIKIPKLKNVKFRRRTFLKFFLENDITFKNITVSRNSASEFYACVLCEYQVKDKPKIFSSCEKQAIGLDFSPASLYIDSNGSDGIRNGYKPHKQPNLKKLAKLERKWQKTTKNSKNREKIRLKLAKLERKIANRRLDFLEKESLRLVQNFELIGIEDLNLQGMIKFSYNAKNYNDASWNLFVQKLLWKASKVEHNCQVVKVDRFFASSKLCSTCGEKYKELKLSDRTWTCPSCGEFLNRDLNAALNIKSEALKIVGLEQSEYYEMLDNVQAIVALKSSMLMTGLGSC